METGKQLEEMANMSPEQLDFNKKMRNFLRFLGMTDGEIALLPQVVRQWDALVDDSNRNFSSIKDFMDEYGPKVDELKAKVEQIDGSAPTGKQKDVVEYLSEAPKGLNPDGR